MRLQAGVAQPRKQFIARETIKAFTGTTEPIPVSQRERGRELAWLLLNDKRICGGGRASDYAEPEQPEEQFPHFEHNAPLSPPCPSFPSNFFLTRYHFTIPNH